MAADDKKGTEVAEEGFLHRWSRRKGEARDGVGQDEEPPEQLPQAKTAEVSEESSASDKEAIDLEALEKIDIESLDYGADFTAFMKEGVPKALRNRALRQLWRSNPVLANVDGLNDYDEDFNVTDKVLEKFESAYKIGRGYLPEEDDDGGAVADEEVHSEDAMAELSGQENPLAAAPEENSSGKEAGRSAGHAENDGNEENQT